MVHGIQNDQNVVAFPLCDFKNEDSLKYKDDPINEYDIKNEDYLKNEHNLKFFGRPIKGAIPQFEHYL